MGGVGAGGDEVEGGAPEGDVAGQVDAPPQAPWEASHEQRADLDRGEEVHGDDAEDHGAGSPVGCEGDEHVGGTEVHVVVGNEPGDVESGERDGGAAVRPSLPHGLFEDRAMPQVHPVEVADRHHGALDRLGELVKAPDDLHGNSVPEAFS